jgi:hypothetical protein
LPDSHEAGSIHQFAAWSFPFLCDGEESSVTIGPDELQRRLIFFVFVAGFSVEILKDATAREIRAIRASATASQLADAADFDLAASFGDIPFACFIARRATGAPAAGSAEGSTTANFKSSHTKSRNKRFKV